MSATETYILILNCKDSVGIIHKISTLLTSLNCNITYIDQYSTNAINGDFFLRLTFWAPSNISYNILTTKLNPIMHELKASFELHKKDQKLRMGILVSNTSHCLAEILYHWAEDELKFEIPFIISNHLTTKKLATFYKIPFHYIDVKKNDKKEDEILKIAQKNCDLMVMARYMQILSNNFISKFKNPIINIHHSFLPAFKGANPYKQAFDKGVKIIGATTHYATKDLDEGPIICQKTTKINHEDDVTDIKRKSILLEKQTLYETLKKFQEHKVIRTGNKTIVF